LLPKALIRNYDQRRLRTLLALLFLGLAIPTGVLTWQAFSQLKWESFYQYRIQAEELTNRIDGSINAAIRTAESRDFTDFAFLNSAPGSKNHVISQILRFSIAHQAAKSSKDRRYRPGRSLKTCQD